MATSTNSTHAPSTTSRTAPQSSTPAQLFYGARGRSGSIASSFARQQAGTSPTSPAPPLPISTSLNTGLSSSSGHGHKHSSSLSSFTFTRSSTFPALSSPVRTTFGPGSPRASSTFIPLDTYANTKHHQRNPSPLGGPSLALPPSTRGLNRANSGTRTYSSGSTYSVSPPHIHARSTSTVVEQIPLTRLPSKQQQSREALIPSAGSTPKQSSADAGFGAMLLNASKRASLLVGKGEDKPPSPRSPAPIPIPTEQGGLQVRDERDKEKGGRQRLIRLPDPYEAAGAANLALHPLLNHITLNRTTDRLTVRQDGNLISALLRRNSSCAIRQRTTPGQDDWAYSVGATGYAYESEPATTPTTPEKRDRSKRNRVTLIPYPFVFSVLLVLGTAALGLAGAGAWLVLLVVVSMGKTAFTDPGIVPRNLDLTPTVDDDGIPYARDIYVRGIPLIDPCDQATVESATIVWTGAITIANGSTTVLGDLLALNVTTIEQLRNSARVSLGGGTESAAPNAFSLGKWTRNAAWGACRPAGLSWVEGWKPVHADQRRLLEVSEEEV
ncbi:hypothetical protein RhiXN_02220 [Rhizoctonia solani]|uniref:Uncharacterized protein n=1 Tax=Rhizoctonia solani TaxID=456999 RepID=A0A8H8P984_9AGAM|nr:uncharacterized protein RhiXN_02220 [Rhizoctonia solani]QRW27625.1 hypothetical protein RhiXN_02220 [Rhizoctonia solani]